MTEVYQVPSIADDLEEIRRPHDFDSAYAQHQPEVLLFARAAERVAAEIQKMPVTVSADILPGKPDPSAEARFASASRAEQYAKHLDCTGDYASVFLDDGESKWTVNGADNASGT